ncbi:MAG: GntR family transcriptional regulator [Candidatus Cryptobacteroides sp.]
MEIDHNSKKPLHLQAEAILRNLIESDEYKNGKLLPNEVDLSAQLNISRNTLRQAINKLVFEGLLVRKKGYGTKVAKKGVVGGVKNWLSFSQEMKMLGIEIRNFELRVSLKQPSDAIKSFFELNPNDNNRCVVLERVRGKKEFPFVYFISYFNPNIPLTGEENYTRPLYEMLESEYNISVKTSKEEISARLAGEFIAEKLEIQANDPILIRKRFVYDINGIPVEYNIGYYRADSFTYTIEAER